MSKRAECAAATSSVVLDDMAAASGTPFAFADLRAVKKSKSMSTIVKTIAILTARPGKVEALAKLFYGMIPHSRAEPGNLAWNVWRDRSDPSRFVLDEVYSDNADVAAHRETPHYKNYLSKISDLADRTVLLLEPDQVV
jgi:quinol monooxygenase YgiN